ncbi:MAG: 50S ribosomal protein L19e [Candidatus Diapherotrites archaeon]|nr:50S ribosomal protein L19e [Candidatus Diapherotrites archaeon]
MEVGKVKKLAARTLGVGVHRVKVMNAERAAEAITREDIRTMVKEKAIKLTPVVGTSRARARILAAKKKAGRRTGAGKRKGTKKVRQKKKRTWMVRVRAQRRKLRELNPTNYRQVYRMIKGGFFKSVKHLQEYVRKGGQ